MGFATAQQLSEVDYCMRLASTTASRHAYFSDDQPSDEWNETREKERRRNEIRETLAHKTGRLWTDDWEFDDVVSNKVDFNNMPEWSPSNVSRISEERVQIYKDKIPTLSVLAHLSLPPPPLPNPGFGQAKAYALYRKRAHYANISSKVRAMAESRIASIQALDDWDSKQDAVDELFEEIEFALKEREEILGKHPLFGAWVESALEEFLRSLQSESKTGMAETKHGSESMPVEVSNDDAKADLDSLESNKSLSDNNSLSLESKEKEADTSEEIDNMRGQNDYEGPSFVDENETAEVANKEKVDNLGERDLDAEAAPVFIDCFNNELDSTEAPVPKILHPLQPNPQLPLKLSKGSMIEEWELAAHNKTKRIMLRQCTRRISRVYSQLDQKPSRILVTGRQGVGKTATLCTIVACARKSGNIVLFLPDGDRLRKNGFYIEPNEKFSGMFDLPILSQQVCNDLILSHENDLAQFQANIGTVEKYFTSEQLANLSSYKGESMSVVDLLKEGAANAALAPMCYSSTIDVLMKQDSKPFLIVADEFNCYYDAGQYFHGDYDPMARKPIPYNQISLFKPILDAMALNMSSISEPVLMARGGILVATTESHAVPKNITESLVLLAKHQKDIHIVDVPRLSPIEVEHMLSNYECIGIGKLRSDRGATVMSEKEVGFLRVVSGSVAQKLMDAAMI